MSNGDLALVNQDLAGLIQNKEEICSLIISFCFGKYWYVRFQIKLAYVDPEIFHKGSPIFKTGKHQFPLPAFHLREFN